MFAEKICLLLKNKLCIVHWKASDNKLWWYSGFLFFIIIILKLTITAIIRLKFYMKEVFILWVKYWYYYRKKVLYFKRIFGYDTHVGTN